MHKVLLEVSDLRPRLLPLVVRVVVCHGVCAAAAILTIGQKGAGRGATSCES